MARDAKEALGELRRYENCLSPESKETRSPKGYESAGDLLSTPRNSVPAKTRGLRLMLITELTGVSPPRLSCGIC